MPIPKKNKPFIRENARDRILHQLYQWLVDGTLKPEERIYDEELSEYFNVSRTPVREALQILNQKHLVEVLPSKCTRVAPITIEETQQTFPLYANLQCIALKFAFPKVNQEFVVKLKELNDKLMCAFSTQSSQAIQSADRDFHWAIINLADNKYLSDMIEELEIHIYRAENYFFAYKERSLQSVSDHKKIIQALAENDLESAVELMYQNWLLNYQGLLESIK